MYYGEPGMSGIGAYDGIGEGMGYITADGQEFAGPAMPPDIAAKLKAPPQFDTVAQYQEWKSGAGSGIPGLIRQATSGAQDIMKMYRDTQMQLEYAKMSPQQRLALQQMMGQQGGAGTGPFFPEPTFWDRNKGWLLPVGIVGILGAAFYFGTRGGRGGVSGRDIAAMPM